MAQNEFTSHSLATLEGMRRRDPQVEIHDLLSEFGMGRDEFVRKLSAELVESLRDFIYDLPSGADSHDKDVSLLLGGRIGELLLLLKIAPPRDYHLDHDVLYHAMTLYHMETLLHSIRVSDAADGMLNNLETPILDGKERNELVLACRFHDIGKIGVPVELLDKSTPLTEKEKRCLQLHQVLSYAIVNKIDRMRSTAEILAYTHVGEGYPNYFRHRAASMPKLSHFLIIADTMDGCLSYRAYRNGARLGTMDVFREQIVERDGDLRHPEDVLLSTAATFGLDRDAALKLLRN